MDDHLAALSPGARVAVVTMVGSLCPITLGHVQCFVEARKLLLNDHSGVPRPKKLERFDDCVGFVVLNPDRFVEKKLNAKGQKSLDVKKRAHCVRLATAELPWLMYTESKALARLESCFPHLRFTPFLMNGADDVLKYRKWTNAGPNHRLTTMGRPGSTAAVLRGMKSAKVAEEHCLLGPELPDISSTAARNASHSGDIASLLQMLHPLVADYLLRSDGHPGLDEAALATLQASGSLEATSQAEDAVVDIPKEAVAIEAS